MPDLPEGLSQADEGKDQAEKGRLNWLLKSIDSMMLQMENSLLLKTFHTTVLPLLRLEMMPYI